MFFQADSGILERMDGTPPTQTLPPPSTGIPGDVEANKDMAALSYAWVLSIFVYFSKHRSPFARFHAKQGMILFLLSIVFWNIPFVGRFLELIVLALCAFGFIAAAQGEWKDVPFIGAIARGQWKDLRNSWRDFVQGVASAWKNMHHEAAPQKSAPVTPPPVAPTPPTEPSQTPPPVPPVPPTPPSTPPTL